MKYYLVTLCLLITLKLSAQVDNHVFEQHLVVNPIDSGQFSIGVNSLGFLKNNEYFNDIADGYTLFGYQINPHLSYQPLPHVKLDVGIYLQKDFGSNGYETILPTYTFKYHQNAFSLIFGTLEGALSHRLVEPLYDFEKALINRIENGLQFKFENKSTFLDIWVDWQNMIYADDNDQEEISGGLSIDHKFVNNDNLNFSVPLQLVVFHRGGQIDTSPLPIQTYTNFAVGASLGFLNWQGVLEGFQFKGYYIYASDMSSEQLQTFDRGSGYYLNINAKTKFNLDVMLSYWQGHEFTSIQGGQLYESTSNTVKNPLYVEENRTLLILRLLHTLALSEKISLSTRVEPFYDFENSTFEFSHGFYINYSTDFIFKRRRE